MSGRPFEERITGWSAPELAERVGRREPEALAAALFELAPGAWLRRAPGRETFVWPGRDDLVLKRTAGSGERRDRWHERLRGRSRSPAQRECENLAGLAAAGVPVPRPLAWVALRGPGGARSALVMERVPAERDLGAELCRAAPNRRRRLVERLAALVARMHAHGWYHRDLYLHHVLLRADQLVLVDVARARRQERPRSRWLEKDLAALLSTAPAALTRTERLRFLSSWCLTLGRGRPGRRLVRRVVAKAERLARHRPRHVEPGGRLDRPGSRRGELGRGGATPRSLAP